MKLDTLMRIAKMKEKNYKQGKLQYNNINI